MKFGPGTYIGPHKILHGKTALGKYSKRGKVLLQFDQFDLKQSHGWHEFLRKHFIFNDPVVWDKEAEHA